MKTSQYIVIGSSQQQPENIYFTVNKMSKMSIFI